MDSFGRRNHLRNYQRNRRTKESYKNRQQREYSYEKPYPETYEGQDEYNSYESPYPKRYEEPRKSNFQRRPYSKTYGEGPHEYERPYPETYEGHYPETYGEEPHEYERPYPETYDGPQHEYYYETPYPETYEEPPSRLKQRENNFKRRQYPESFKERQQKLPQQREYKRRQYPETAEEQQGKIKDIRKPLLQHETKKQGKARFHNEKMKVIESCQSVVNKINEIENNNTRDTISKQKNEKELSQTSRYLIEMDDTRDIKLKINGTNGDINIQNQNLGSKLNKCNEKLTETKNSESIPIDKKEFFREKGSLICKINRTPLVDNLIQNASSKELYKNKRENENQIDEINSETTIKDQSNKKLKLEQENSKQKAISVNNENIKSGKLSPSIKTDKEHNNKVITKDGNLLNINKDNELNVNLDTNNKEENLKESGFTESSTKDNNVKNINKDATATNDNNVININNDCTANVSSLVNINKDCLNGDDKEIDGSQIQTEIDSTQTQPEENVEKIQTEKECTKAHSEEDNKKNQTEEDCTKTEDNTTQDEEDIIKVQIGEYSVKTPTEEDSIKIQAEEESKKTQAEEQSKKIQTEEESKKPQAEEECKKTQEEEECKTTQEEEDCLKIESEEHCLKTQIEDCIKTLTNEVSLKIDGEESVNKPKRSRDVSFDSDDDDEPSTKKIILDSESNNYDNELTPKVLDNNKKEDLDKVNEKEIKFSENCDESQTKQEERITNRNEDIIEIDNVSETKTPSNINEDKKDIEVKEDSKEKEDNDIILINDEPRNFLLKEKRTPLPGLQKFITEEKPILTKKDLNDIIIQQFCNIINSKSDLGQTRAKCHFLEQSNKKLKVQLESVNKQVGHLQSALQKLSAQSEGKDKQPMPLKLVRSVAIQIGRSRALLGNLPNSQQTQSGPSNLLNKSKQFVATNSTNTPVSVNNTSISQRAPDVSLPRSSSTSLPTQDISKVNSPPLKGIRTLLPRTNIPKTPEPRLQPQMKPLPTLTPSPKVLPTVFKPKTPPILAPNLTPNPSNPNIPNRPKPLPVKMPTEPPKLTPKTNNNVIDIDLTDDDEPTKKMQLSSALRPSPNRKISSPAVGPTVNNTLQTLKSAPVQQVAWNNLVPQKGNEIRLISNGGIRLPSQKGGLSTFLLSPAPNMPPNVLMTTPNSSNDMANQTTYFLKNGKLINAQLSVVHPAPLPPQPVAAQNPSWLAPPPRPELQISRVNAKTPNGIVLSWMMSLNRDYAEIVSYQLYAYEETQGIKPSTGLWKKVGDVKALPLPMACTLTQFVVGHKYHFAVRAVDVHARIGPFSQPGSIVLVGK